jgi:hypothetical protein
MAASGRLEPTDRRPANGRYRRNLAVGEHTGEVTGIHPLLGHSAFALGMALPAPKRAFCTTKV